MRTLDVPALRADPAARFRAGAEFVGLGPDDVAALAESAGLLGPKLPGLLDAIYDHLLSFDDTRRVFLGPRGELDPSYMALRKEHLTEWVLRTVDASDVESLARYVALVARRHTRTEGDDARQVPPRYMAWLMTFVQAALWATLFELLPGEPARVARYGLAWTKMLGIQLELMLHQMAPAFPGWDER